MHKIYRAQVVKSIKHKQIVANNVNKVEYILFGVRENN